MSRLKTFLLYGLAIAGLYFLSNILIFLSVKGMYQPMKGKVLVKSPAIEITEAKATYMNGYVDGIIKNDTGEKIENKYIKIDIYSERDINLGTKYIKMENLEVNQTQEVHMGYRYMDSYRYEVDIVEDVTDVAEEQFVSEDLSGYLLLSGLLALCFM